MTKLVAKLHLFMPVVVVIVIVVADDYESILVLRLPPAHFAFNLLIKMSSWACILFTLVEVNSLIERERGRGGGSGRRVMSCVCGCPLWRPLLELCMSLARNQR